MPRPRQSNRFGDQLEMSDHDELDGVRREGRAPANGRPARAAEGAAPRLTDRDLVRLADLVAQRVVAAVRPTSNVLRQQGVPGAIGLDAPTRDGTEHQISRLLASEIGKAAPSGVEAQSAGALLSADELAGMLGVTTGWIYAQSRAGRIPTVKLGRYYRYRLGAIKQWIATQEDWTQSRGPDGPTPGSQVVCSGVTVRARR